MTGAARRLDSMSDEPTYTAFLAGGPADGETRVLSGFQPRPSLEVDAVTGGNSMITVAGKPVTMKHATAAFYRLRALDGHPARHPNRDAYIYDWDPTWTRRKRR